MFNVVRLLCLFATLNFCSCLVARTVYVDNSFGSDIFGTLYSQSRPVKTVTKALNLIYMHGNGEEFDIVVNPGSYGSVVLPGNVNLIGTYGSYFDSLVIKGPTKVEGIEIQSEFKTSLTINASNSDFVYIRNIRVSNKGVPIDPVLINNIAGDVELWDSSFTANMLSSMHDISFIKNTGTELEIINTNIDVDIVTAPTTIFVKSVGKPGGSSQDCNFKWNNGFGKMQVATGGSLSTLFYGERSNIEAISRFNHNNKASLSILVDAVGDGTHKFSGTFNYKTTGTVYSARGTPEGSNLPEVRYNGANFVKKSIPPSTGSFSQYAIITMGVGGINSNQAIRFGYRSLSSNDSLIDDDGFVILSVPNIYFTLTMPNNINSPGRFVFVHNNSTGYVTILGPISGGNIELAPNSGSTFVNSATQWFSVK